MKISKYVKYGEYAKTIEILSRLTKNKFKITPVDKFDEPKQKGVTRNTTGILTYIGLNRWEIKFIKGYEKVIPHELCHVIDSVASLKQTSLKKEFREIADNYAQNYRNYEKQKKVLYAKLNNDIENQVSDAELNNDIEYQTRNAECFARLLNSWAYETDLIDMPPVELSEGDTFATLYYMRNKDIIDDYFNELFADEIADLIADGLVEGVNQLAETNNLSL